MDSGLGSDEERRFQRPLLGAVGGGATTKEQKQRLNERLLIGCFIDASSLSDDAEVVPVMLPVSTTVAVSTTVTPSTCQQVDSNNQLRTSSRGNSFEDERSKGALLFRTSIPQYSMLQMQVNMHEDNQLDDVAPSESEDLSGQYENSARSNYNRSDFLQNRTFHSNGSDFFLDTGANSTVYSSSSSLSSTSFRCKEKEPSLTCDTPFNSMVQISLPTSNEKERDECDCEYTDGEEEKTLKDEDDAEIHKTSLGFYVDLSEVEEPEPPTIEIAAKKKNIFSMVIDFEAPKKDKPRLASSLLKNSSNRNSGSKRKNSLQSDSPCTKGDVSSSSVSPSAPRSPNVCRRFSENETTSPKDNVNTKISSNSKSPSPITSEDKSESSSQFVRLSDLDKNEGKKTNISPINTNARSNQQNGTLDNHFQISGSNMSKSIPPPTSFVESPMFLMMSRSVATYRSSPPLHSNNKSNSSTNTSATTPTHRSSSGGNRSAARLGTDLLRMFLEEIETDLQISVNGRRMRAHRCILASRCQYFAAVLSGNTKSETIVPLDGFTYDAVHFGMCHIYSGASHVPDSVSLVELASLADLLCLEGLKEVVANELSRRYCHSFHTPCDNSLLHCTSLEKDSEDGGCIVGVLEVLPLAAAYGLDDLYQNCLTWISKYFTIIWPTRSFGQLPRELRDKCHRHIEVHLTSENVFDILHKCEILQKFSSLGTISDKSNFTPRWVEVVHTLVTRLKDDCRLFIRRHYANVLEGLQILVKEKKIFVHDNHVMDLEHLRNILVSTAGTITSADQLCRSYIKCRKIICSLSVANISDVLDCHIEGLLRKDTFLSILRDVQQVLENSLFEIGDRITKCSTWDRLDTPLRERIKLKLSQHSDNIEIKSNINKTKAVPASPSATRLPRATKTTRARESYAAQQRNNQQQLQQKQRQNKQNNRIHTVQSSSESSRNSSPLTSNRRHVFRNASGSNISSTSLGGNSDRNHLIGSPSMRRSLHVGPRAPQVPPSPSVSRKNAASSIQKVSTLTQPTASSAAKSAPPRHLRTPPPNSYQSRSAPSSGRLDQRTVTRNQQYSTRTSVTNRSISHTSSASNIKNAFGKQNLSDVTKINKTSPKSNKKPQDSKCKTSIPFTNIKKSEVTSIRKQKSSETNSNISTEQISGRSSNTTGSNTSSPTYSKKKSKEVPPECSLMQRSGTFLKEKPTVLLIEHQNTQNVE